MQRSDSVLFAASAPGPHLNHRGPATGQRPIPPGRLPALVVLWLACLCASLMAQDPETRTSAEPQLLLVGISGSLADETPAHALCLAKINPAESGTGVGLGTFCYYVFTSTSTSTSTTEVFRDNYQEGWDGKLRAVDDKEPARHQTWADHTQAYPPKGPIAEAVDSAMNRMLLGRPDAPLGTPSQLIELASQTTGLRAVIWRGQASAAAMRSRDRKEFAIIANSIARSEAFREEIRCRAGLVPVSEALGKAPEDPKDAVDDAETETALAENKDKNANKSVNAQKIKAAKKEGPASVSGGLMAWLARCRYWRETALLVVLLLFLGLMAYGNRALLRRKLTALERQTWRERYEWVRSSTRTTEAERTLDGLLERLVNNLGKVSQGRLEAAELGPIITAFSRFRADMLLEPSDREKKERIRRQVLDMVGKDHDQKEQLDLIEYGVRQGRVAADCLARITGVKGTQGPESMAEVVKSTLARMNRASQAAHSAVNHGAPSITDLPCLADEWERLTRLVTALATEIESIEGLDLERQLASAVGDSPLSYERQVEEINMKIRGYGDLEEAFSGLGSSARIGEVIRPLVQLYQAIQTSFNDGQLTPGTARTRTLELFQSIRQLAMRPEIAARSTGNGSSLELAPLEITEYLDALGEERAAHDSIRKQLEVKEQELADLGRFLSGCATGDETLAETAERLAHQQRAAVHSLMPFFAEGCTDSGEVEPEELDLAEMIHALHRWVDRTITKVRDVLPDFEGSGSEAVTELVSRFLILQDTLLASSSLSKALSKCLHLDSVDLRNAGEIKKRARHIDFEREHEHQTLRLGLAAALLGIEKETGRLLASGRHDVVKALRLQTLSGELQGRLVALESLSEDGLWSQCLQAGFSQDWLHDLFRARSLLNGYFRSVPLFHRLRRSLEIACSAVSFSLHHFDCRVQNVRLLAPLPSDTRDLRTEIRQVAAPDLREVPEVKARVLRGLETVQGFVVDVESFPWVLNNQYQGVCRVVLATPGQWR